MLFGLALLGFLMFNYKPQHQTPLGGFQQAGMVVASIFMCRAAVVAGGDFSGGTIRPWLIARPRRSEVFLGKLAASLTLGVVFCVVAGVMGYVASAVQSKTPTVSHDAAVAGELLIGIGALTLFGHAYIPFLILEIGALVVFLRQDVNS